MDVAKALTGKISLAIAVICGVLASHANAAPKTWIIRLKKEETKSGLVAAQATARAQTRLVDFKRARLAKKKGLVLPRMEFLVTTDLSANEITELRADPSVAYVEEDISWRTQDSPGAPSSWPSSFEEAPWLRDLMGFSENYPDPEVAPDLSTKRTVVAVIDTGSRSDHPFLSAALEPNVRELEGRSGVDDDQNGFVDDTWGANAITRKSSGTETYSSHGTHVAGIVKTIRDHALSEFPESRQVSILPVRFIGDDGSGSTATAIVALEYALSRGARVVNASWGAKGNSAYSQALYDAFAKLYANDVFFSVAAGNADGFGPNDNDSIPYFPANYNIPSLLSVASVTPYYNSNEERLVSVELSDFSNFGKRSVQIAAPGDYADGRGSTSGILSAYSGFGTWGHLYIKKQGTSMAAPVIAGIAAVMRAVNPELTAYEIRKLLLDSAHSYRALGSIESSSLVHARDAIVLAKNTPSQGLRPRLPAAPVRQSTSLETEPEERSSGCASVSPVKPQGPFGGNSLGLIAVAYALWALQRSQRKKSRV